MSATESDEHPEDGLRAEYHFDYRKAKPNRFALGADQQVVILDADVAKYFRDSESVNRVLRAIISNLPVS